jgi:hypothetical protein
MSYGDERYELVSIGEPPGALERLLGRGRRLLGRWCLKLLLRVRLEVEGDK